MKTIVLPDSLIMIGDWVFAYSGLRSLVIPGRVTTMGVGIFSDCKALKSVVIPASLRNVESHCFAWCDKLSKVSISSASISFHSDAFYGASRMEKLAVAAGLPCPSYVIHRFECECDNELRRKYVLVAFARFCRILQNTDGTEGERFAAARALYPPRVSPRRLSVANLFTACIQGGGFKGVLGHTLKYV